ncbi:MAG: methyltransferase domain-containing protein [Dehalococcoidales bacterium]|nr:MAG: methyltransferase domain-containing protein [Dehalococcoidales bacterium]
MNPEAMKPFGQALVDYYKGDSSATVITYRDDGFRIEMPISPFYRESTDMDIDRIALENCRGRILDVGAGTGLHSLHLQDQGLSVCAIDISPEACEIMRKRGLNEVYCTDISVFKAEPFDTLLMLGHGIGVVENMTGLDHFLTNVHHLVKSDGQIVLNSVDVSCTDSPTHLAYHEVNRQAGRYVGEIRMHFEYEGLKGPVCGWLHIDSETLANHASKAGWSCTVLFQEEDGNYLAKLTKAG